jgi:hypothetical protein
MNSVVKYCFFLVPPLFFNDFEFSGGRVGVLKHLERTLQHYFLLTTLLIVIFFIKSSNIY